MAERRAALAAAEAALAALLPRLAAQLGVRSLGYVSLQNQGDYLVEVPQDLVPRVPRDWLRVSATKKAARYHPPAVTAAMRELDLSREHLQASVRL